MSDLKDKLADGCFYELPRDQAKSFFGCRDVESVSTFLSELKSNEATKRLSLGPSTLLLAQCFSDGSIYKPEGTPPLAWCFQGGRAMPAAESSVVNLLRPDMVGHIAAHLTEIGNGSEWVNTRVNELTLDPSHDVTDDQKKQASDSMTELHTFLDAAAKSGSAVIFATV